MSVFSWLWSMCVNLLWLHQTTPSPSTAPNIILILADDLGWNDVGWNNPQIQTPNLNHLAREGIILNSSYASPLCSPSRAALLTGYYPFRLGLQHGVMKKTKPHGLPTNFTLLPEKLRELGYSTHIVGKWHLGFCKWEYTPTYRGFDSFYGFYAGSQDYYHHRTSDVHGYDFRSNEAVLRPTAERYSTVDYGREASSIIRSHNTDNPLFLYLAFQGVHTPLQVPRKFERKYSNVLNRDRRIYSGMVSALDEAVGSVVRALKKNNMYRNTIIVFTSDNGGTPYYGGNNWPLRGGKSTVWEGGTRVPTFIWGRMLRHSRTTTELFHITDWFPTLLAAAGGTADSDISGLNQWPTLQRANIPSPRTQFVYAINEETGRAALRMGKYKLIRGSPGHYRDWYPPPQNTSRHSIRLKKNRDKLSERTVDSTLLYNILDDPIESNDLSSTYPDVVHYMNAILDEHTQQAMPAFNPRKVRLAQPKFWNGVWSPGWC